MSGALLGIEATAGLSAANLGLTWGQTIEPGQYEVGAPGLTNNPVRMEKIERPYALADGPTTKKQYANGLKQLKGRNTVLMTPLPQHRWGILARGTLDEVGKVKTDILRKIAEEMGILGKTESPRIVADHVAGGALQAFDLGNAPIRIIPVTLEPHLPEGFDRPNQPALTTAFAASAFATLFNSELPTGIEWEIAAADLRDEKYRKEKNLRRVAHLRPAKATADVKTKEPNQRGYFDMLGNVCEAMANPYKEGGEAREFRGFSWYGRPVVVRVAIRLGIHPDCWYGGGGFRLLRRL